MDYSNASRKGHYAGVRLWDAKRSCFQLGLQHSCYGTQPQIGLSTVDVAKALVWVFRGYQVGMSMPQDCRVHHDAGGPSLCTAVPVSIAA